MVILFADGKSLNAHTAYKLNKESISIFEKPLLIRRKINPINIKIVNNSKKTFIILFKKSNRFVRSIEILLLYLKCFKKNCLDYLF